MHANYQGLDRDPFPNRPSPDVFFDSSVHRGAWSFLRGSVRAGEPFIMLTGDFGTGKTLLALKLVNALTSKNLGGCVYISTPAQGYIEVLRRAYRTLGLGEPSEDLDTDRLLDRIYAYFESERPGRRLFLVVEDPQDLDPETLHRIRLLPNYNVDGRYPICLVLFAHTSFPRMLKQSRWQALDQRIKLRYHITGFDRAETREYIYFRLLRAQSQGVDPFSPYFEEAAIDRIYDLTGGIPRDINNLCGMCLTLGGSRRIVALRTDLVDEAAHLVGHSSADRTPAGASQTTAAGRSGGPAAERPSSQSPAPAPQPAEAARPAQSGPAEAPAATADPGAQHRPGPGATAQPAPNYTFAPGGQGAAPSGGYAPQPGGPTTAMPGYAPAAWGAGPTAASGPGPAAGNDEGLGGQGADGGDAGRSRGALGSGEGLTGSSSKANMIWWSAVGAFVVLIAIAVLARNVDLTTLLG